MLSSLSVYQELSLFFFIKILILPSDQTSFSAFLVPPTSTYVPLLGEIVVTSASTQSPSLSLTKHSVSLVLKFLILRRFNTSAALITYSSLVWTCHLWILEVHFILSFHYKVHYFSLHFSFLMYVPPLIPCISSVAVFIHLQELHHLSPCMCVCVCVQLVVCCCLMLCVLPVYRLRCCLRD